MTPLGWTLAGLLDPLSLFLVLPAKWWTIWFVLGRDFTRTSLLCLSVVALHGALAFLLLRSGAVGPPDGEIQDFGLRTSSWLATLATVAVAGLAVEFAWLRACMRRLVRRDWNWRRYDRLGYGVVHVLLLVALFAWALWRVGAFRVS